MDYNPITDMLDQEFEQRRIQNYALYQQKQREACDHCPGLEELLTQRHAMVMSGIRYGILHRDGGEAPSDAATAMKEINRQIRQKLQEAGLPEDSLKPIYTCPVCKDEGFYYNPGRTMCECYRKALSEKMLQQFVHPDHCFENFDSGIYQDEIVLSSDTKEYSQKTLANLAMKYCRDYAESYPHCEQNNILMIGQSGLGKTFLLDCIARRLVERGFNPCYIIAYQLFEDMHKAVFENETERIDRLMNADILLLDDLGSEPIFNNMTIELLFNILNTRIRNKRHTVITTNLTQDEIRKKYTERISSRLLDPYQTKLIRFYGTDVRRRKGEALR